MEQRLKDYLVSAGYATDSTELSVELLDGGKSHNHLNYKVVTPRNTFVARVAVPNNLVTYANIPDEYTILKCVESYVVGPRALHVDLEYFDTPLLFEEYVEGILFQDIRGASQENLMAAVELLAKISKIQLPPEKFPFKHSYTTYETNFKTWRTRIEDIASQLGNEHETVRELDLLAKEAREVLAPLDATLRKVPSEFIYNDVHPGNIFLLPDGSARFVDWQKVSLGDPSFMLALFAKRFGHIWKLEQGVFTEKVLVLYRKEKEVSEGFEKLLRMRMFERTVSDAIWVVWAGLKRKEQAVSLEDNAHFQKAKSMLIK